MNFTRFPIKLLTTMLFVALMLLLDLHTLIINTDLYVNKTFSTRWDAGDGPLRRYLITNLSIDLERFDAGGFSPLFYAIHSGKSDAVEYLVARVGCTHVIETYEIVVKEELVRKGKGVSALEKRIESCKEALQGQVH